MFIRVDDCFCFNGVPLKRVKSDKYGNPRYIVSILSLVTEEEFYTLKPVQYSEIAKKRANNYGMRVNRMKDYPNTFIFPSYSIEADVKYIAEIKAGDKKGVGV